MNENSHLMLNLLNLVIFKTILHFVFTSKDKAERDVYMFHYTQWPDHGVPEPLSLVVFHRHLMKTAAEHPMGYIVVNCR